MRSELRRLREAGGLTQEELARRAGVSRQLVGAVETGRHLPRVDAALALSAALGVDVAALFPPDLPAVDVVTGSAPPEGAVVRVGRVGDRTVTAPARAGEDGWDAADGVVDAGRVVLLDDRRASGGVVVAGCEPGLETLEDLLRRGGGGALAVATSTAGALAALDGERVHAAVVHGPPGRFPVPPAGVARFRLTAWRVGLGVPPGLGGSWWADVRSGKLPVVQREEGAGVQRTFEEAAGAGRPGPRVSGHLRAARYGMAAGIPAVTIEPAALAAGADFHPLDRHEAELWVGGLWAGSPAVVDLLTVVASPGFRRRLQAVGGYELDGSGGRVA